MKIYGSTNQYFNNAKINRPNGQAPKIAENPQPGKTVTKQKKVIPDGHILKANLSEDEQKFFEDIYPNSRREIRSYVRNQNKVQVEKGKYIDMRG
jgi:hypothetical protein